MAGSIRRAVRPARRPPARRFRPRPGRPGGRTRPDIPRCRWCRGWRHGQPPQKQPAVPRGGGRESSSGGRMAGSLTMPFFPSCRGWASNWGFIRQRHSPSSRSTRSAAGKNALEGNEGNIGRDQLTGQRRGAEGLQLFEREVPGVGAFHHRDPLVLPQLPGKDAIGHVHRKHMRGPVLQQTVGEAAVGGADIARRHPRRIHGEHIQRLGPACSRSGWRICAPSP